MGPWNGGPARRSRGLGTWGGVVIPREADDGPRRLGLNELMLRLPLIATAVVAAAVALLPPVISGEHTLVAVGAALALVVGVWCAPTSFAREQTGSLLFIGREIWTQRMAWHKAFQLIIGGLAVVGLDLIGAVSLGVAAIIGIALALGFGASGSDRRSRD